MPDLGALNSYKLCRRDVIFRIFLVDFLLIISIVWRGPESRHIVLTKSKGNAKMDTNKRRRMRASQKVNRSEFIQLRETG